MDRSAPNNLHIRLTGEFDVSDRQRLTAMLRPAESADAVVLDMSETTYLDSTALGCLIHLKQQLIPRGGAVRIVGLQPNIRHLFEITRLDELFELGDQSVVR